MASRPALLGLSVVLLIGLALRVAFPFGLVKVDPFTYADAAISIARWQSVYDSSLTGDVYYTQYIRLTLVVPAALLYRIFGINDLTSVAFPVALSLAMSVMGWWFLRRALGERPALWAAAVVAVFPLYVVNSTQFLPDVVQAAFAALAMVTFLRALLFDDLSQRRRAWLYFTSGAALALAFYSRGTAVALLPPLALLLALHWRRFDWTPLMCAAGGLAVLLVFQCLMIALGSEPLEDFRVLYRLGSGSSFDPGAGYLRVLFTDPGFWPFTLVAIAGVLLWAYQERRDLVRSPLIPLVILTVGQYIYFEYFMSLPGTSGWWKEPRYILSLAFPVLLLAGTGVGLAFDRLAGKSRSLEVGLGGAVGIALIGASVYGAWDEYDFYQVDGNPWDSQPSEVARFLNQQSRDDVFISNDDFARPLSFHMGGGGTFYERAVSDDGELRRRFGPGATSRVTPNSHVVVAPREDWWPMVTASAPHWKRVFGGAGQAAVYEVVEPAAGEFAAQRDPGEAARDLGIDSVALSESWLLPGHHAAIQLTFSAPVPGSVLDMQMVCGGLRGDPTALVVPAGATVVQTDVFLRAPGGIAAPTRCSIEASGRDLIDVLVPLAVVSEAEDLAGPGWSDFFDSRFSGVIGLIGTGNLSLEVPVPRLDAGEYWVEARLYDAGSGTGEIRATLNGVPSTTTWGSGDQEAGVTSAVLHFASVPEGSELKLHFSGDQPAVLLDAFVVSSVEPPASER